MPRVTLPRRLRHSSDREILRLALPAFFALVAEPAFLLVDAAIVGRLGTAPLAGLGIGTAAISAVASMCIFLAYGTTAAVARRLGAGDVRGAVQQGVDGMWLGGLLGLAIAALGVVAAPAVVAAFGTSPTVTPYAETWLRVAVLHVPALLVVLAATGVLRGLQDTRTPLVVAVVSSAANAGLNALLVFGAGLGVAGSAWGTVVAQTGAAVAYGVAVRRAARRHGAALRPDVAGIRRSAASGVPLMVRTLSMRAVLLVAAAVAARLGDADLAAYQVSYTIWTFLALALDAVAIAGQALVGRYLGAGDDAGARAATRRMLEWGVAAGAVLAVLLVALRPVYVPWFSPAADVQALLSAALVVVAVLQLPGGPVFVYDGVLIGAGDLRYLAVVGVVTGLLFLPAAAVVLAFDLGLVGLWWALGVWLLGRLALLARRERGAAWLVTGAVR